MLTSQCCRDEVEVARVATDAADLEFRVRSAVAAVQEVVSQDVLADFWGPRREPAVPPTTVCRLLCQHTGGLGSCEDQLASAVVLEGNDGPH